MSSPKVSVVVPVYNVERFLAQCLESILTQTLREIEVICVDDGSTDSSRSILRSFREKDDRLILVEQSNTGAGAARNLGLSMARGKYISFLDSDDWFEPEMLEKAYERCELDRAQICIFRTQYVDEMTGNVAVAPWKLQLNKIPSQRPFSWRDIPSTLFNFCDGCAWDKLFLASFVRENSCQFGEYPNCEDTKFTFAALSCAERITWLDEVFVNYRSNQTTSLTGGLSKAPYCFLETYGYLQERLKRAGTYEKLSQSLNNRALDCAHWTASRLDPKTTDSFLLRMNAADYTAEGWKSLEITPHPCTWYYSEKQYLWLHSVLLTSPFLTFVLIINKDTDPRELERFLVALFRYYDLAVFNHPKQDRDFELICFYDELTEELRQVIDEHSVYVRHYVFLKRGTTKPWNLYNEAIDLARGYYIAFLPIPHPHYITELLERDDCYFDNYFHQKKGVDVVLRDAPDQIYFLLSTPENMRRVIIHGVFTCHKLSHLRETGIRFTPPQTELPFLSFVQLFQLNVFCSPLPCFYDKSSEFHAIEPLKQDPELQRILMLRRYSHEVLDKLSSYCLEEERIRLLLEVIRQFLKKNIRSGNGCIELTPEEFLRDLIGGVFSINPPDEWINRPHLRNFKRFVLALQSEEGLKDLQKRIARVKVSGKIHPSRKKRQSYRRQYRLLSWYLGIAMIPTDVE